MEVLFGFDWVGGQKVVGGGAWRNARACVVDWMDFFLKKGELGKCTVAMTLKLCISFPTPAGPIVVSYLVYQRFSLVRRKSDGAYFFAIIKNKS